MSPLGGAADAFDHAPASHPEESLAVLRLQLGMQVEMLLGLLAALVEHADALPE